MNPNSLRIAKALEAAGERPSSVVERLAAEPSAVSTQGFRNAQQARGNTFSPGDLTLCFMIDLGDGLCSAASCCVSLRGGALAARFCRGFGDLLSLLRLSGSSDKAPNLPISITAQSLANHHPITTSQALAYASNGAPAPYAPADEQCTFAPALSETTRRIVAGMDAFGRPADFVERQARAVLVIVVSFLLRATSGFGFPWVSGALLSSSRDAEKSTSGGERNMLRPKDSAPQRQANISRVLFSSPRSPPLTRHRRSARTRRRPSASASSARRRWSRSAPSTRSCRRRRRRAHMPGEETHLFALPCLVSLRVLCLRDGAVRGRCCRMGKGAKQK